jgi:predicted nucleic acid-binding protein
MVADSMPENIYVDTSVIAPAMLVGVAHHSTCAVFCNRLVVDDCRVYFSLLLRLEIAQTVQNFAARNSGAQLPETVRQQHQIDQWSASFEVRRRWLFFGLSRLSALLARFAEYVELPIRAPLYDDSVELMARWELGSNDALHIATAQAHGIQYFATTDRGFRDVSNPMIWLIRDDTPSPLARRS